MKIKTQFISSMAIFGIILLIIAASVIATNQQVEQLNNQEEIAKRIERAASELSYLSNDYLLYHESQQRARWESKFSQLSDDLSNLDPSSPEQQTLVNNIRSNQQRLKAVFADVVSIFENTSQGADQALFQISWSRMAVQNQGMAFDAERLSQMLREQADQLKQTNTTLISVLLGIFGAYFITNYLIVYHRALKSISDLQSGIRIIGSGDLDYSIKMNRQDEIGNLSRAFNQMTANLKVVTASKAELEKEITERKRVENALRESEKRYRSLFENMMDGFAYCKMLFDDDGRPADFVYLDVNSAFGRLTGLENVAGKKVTDVIPGIKESNPELFEIYGRVALKGQPETFEIEFKLLGAWLSISVYSPERGYFAAVFDNITERKRAEETLRKAHDELEVRVRERTEELSEANKTLLGEIDERKRAEEKIREQAALLDKAHDAIGLRNLEHDLIYWNKGAEYLYGWKAEEAIGKNADKLLYKEKTPRLIEAEKSVIEKGEWAGELHQVTKDGKEIIVESRWTLIYDGEGKPKSILAINTDITEKKKIELQLLRVQRMESIGTLASGIAHDLNNVLTPIMLSLQMLKERFKDEQSLKLLTILEKNSQRGADLIKQVLSFARGVEGERKPIQIMKHISEIEKILKETLPRNIEIRTDIQKDLFTISGDATQLHQVIMNLCVNARDAMPDGGILNISAENFLNDENYALMHTEAKSGPYVVVGVSDNGTGIPPKIVDRVFEPFFTTKEFGKGTGLGLSTALAIVKSHGGFINVYSEVGKGTTFRVYLPSIKTELQNVKVEQFELPVGNEELVLVAEDEDSIREVTVSTLEAYGYKVLTANDGAGAVALYAQNKDKIEVILMDMMMPVMDGHASIRAIRKINPGVKIIAVSGLAENDKLAKIADSRVHAFLTKPYAAERLLKTIHEVLSAK